MILTQLNTVTRGKSRYKKEKTLIVPRLTELRLLKMAVVIAQDKIKNTLHMLGETVI